MKEKELQAVYGQLQTMSTILKDYEDDSILNVLNNLLEEYDTKIRNIIRRKCYNAVPFQMIGVAEDISSSFASYKFKCTMDSLKQSLECYVNGKKHPHGPRPLYRPWELINDTSFPVLSNRVLYILQRNGLLDVNSLLKLNYNQIMALSGMGKQTINEVIEFANAWCKFLSMPRLEIPDNTKDILRIYPLYDYVEDGALSDKAYTTLILNDCFNEEELHELSYLDISNMVGMTDKQFRLIALLKEKLGDVL